MSRRERVARAALPLGFGIALVCCDGGSDAVAPPVTGTSGLDASVPDAPPDRPFFVGEVICGDFEAVSPPCAACSRASCCDEGNACADDADCASLVACLRRCSSIDAGAGCFEGCKGDHAAGTKTLSALAACARESCASECPGTGGGGIAGVVLEPALGHCADESSCAWSDCKDCDGVADNGCEASLFESPYDCGACGNACAGGQVCSHGLCAAVASAPVSTVAADLVVADALAVGGGFVYFDGFDQVSSHPIVRRVPVGGGAVQTLVTTNESGGGVALAADETYAYAVTSGAVRRIAHATGQVELVATPPDPLDAFSRAATSGGTLYTLEISGSASTTSLVSIAAGSTTPVVMATASPDQLDGPIAADARGVFVSSTSTGLYFVAAAGPFPSTPSLLAPGSSPLQTLLSDGADLFAAAGGAILRIDGASGVKTTLATTEPGAAALALDATSVFYEAATPGWGASWDPTRLAKDGSSATVLAKGQQASAFAASGGVLYFVTSDATGAALRSVPIP